ncbi:MULTISPECIES: septum formation initiator family protein [unclassified Wenzhouxiangella]|uniref:septum formation initiator family protein n=1 Tax=unclassified Wenzhouxiangella TaxID=2613841 RepID=UPI000E327075|nr:MULTISPECIES: septum formation initiator family protein [unclassified Wenzhouxiangella]RFF27590.1 cell division protein FtsB [Wenzhouxiangella sp. 15181]RFP70115.1 cell division protein FtsB [Wenzhouxiangella sp. 15190]
MRVILIVLLVILVLLQVQLWRQYSEVQTLHELVEQQQSENEELEKRNEALAAEVEDLRAGLDAIEERARSELGLIREGEDFFLIVDPEDAEPES